MNPPPPATDRDLPATGRTRRISPVDKRRSGAETASSAGGASHLAALSPPREVGDARAQRSEHRSTAGSSCQLDPVRSTDVIESIAEQFAFLILELVG